MSHWLSNDWKMTSHRNLKLRFFWKLFRSSKRFLICFWCYLRSVVTRVNNLLENWPSLKKECRICQAATEKWRHVETFYKLRFLVWGFHIQFGVILELWSPAVIMQVKNGHYETKNVRVAGSRQKNYVAHQLETRCL